VKNRFQNLPFKFNLQRYMAVQIARTFMRAMAQPYDRGEAGKQLLDQASVNAMANAAGYGPPAPPPTKQIAGNLCLQ
jgi:hypothetical protein